MVGHARPPLRWFWSVLTFASAAWATERAGNASTAVSIYTAVSRVEMLPSQANATEAVIHGAFMFLDSGGNYADAVCGYMYFRCPSGSESLCRMQWLDIQTMGTMAGQCAGFGSQSSVSTAHVRTEGTALTSPDTWDLGIGVQSGTYIGGKCAPAKLLSCAMPALLDGGTPDVPITVDSPPAQDSRGSDGSVGAESGARDVGGSEAGITVDAGAMADQRDARDAVLLDEAPADARAPIDVSTADAHVADVPVLIADASPDLATVPVRDAAPGNRDASAPGAPSDSDGCGCRLGGKSGDDRGALPIGLLLFAALAGIAVLRRVR